MKKYFILVVALVIGFVSSCKIQEAPGAYQAAAGKVEKTKDADKKAASPSQTETAPAQANLTDAGQKSTNVQNGGALVLTPDEVVRKGLNTNAQADDIVEVPQMESEEPILPNQPPVVEKDDHPDVATRSEKIEFVQGSQENAKKMYHVVIGSFGKKENAQRLLTEWSSGYAPLIAVNEKGMFRVVLSSHDQYEQAKSAAAAVKEQIPDVWVLIKLQ